MLIASVGPAMAADLGLANAFADEPVAKPTFGPLELLMALMEETPLDRLQPLLVAKLKEGTDLRALVAAGAVANARRWNGGESPDFHAFMAMAPAWEMSRELPEGRRALPVLKVLYWNAAELQQSRAPIFPPSSRSKSPRIGPAGNCCARRSGRTMCRAPKASSRR